jgi:hypothetical protein
VANERNLRLDDPESLRGAPMEDVIALIPDEWEKRPSRTEGGVRAFRPGTRYSDYVRVMPGNPRAADGLHRGPRVIVAIRGRKWVEPLKGNPVLE